MPTPMSVIAAVAKAYTGQADEKVALNEFLSDGADALSEESRTLLFDFISSRTVDPDKDPEFQALLQETLQLVAESERERADVPSDLARVQSVARETTKYRPH